MEVTLSEKGRLAERAGVKGATMRMSRNLGVPNFCLPSFCLSGMLVLLLLGGCVAQAPIPGREVEIGRLPSDFPWQRYQRPQHESEQLYRVDSLASRLTIFVGRAGPLQRLGHNHVIQSRDLVGFALKKAVLAQSYADLYVPVVNLVVDDHEDRIKAGEGFESIPSAADIQGTRTNMLGPEVLDAANFPWIHIRVGVPESSAAGGDEAAGVIHLTAEITLRNHTSILPLALTWTVTDGVIRLGGRFRMTHEQLGLNPFSTLGGALRVAEEINFQLDLTLFPADLAQPPATNSRRSQGPLEQSMIIR